MSVGFVSVPVVPTFEGMSKAFADRLEKPAKESGARAGKSISDGLNGAVLNLEKQVKASTTKLGELDRAYEKTRGKQKVREAEEEEAKKTLARLEAEHAKAVADGSKITESAYKALSAAKIKAKKASNDLRDAEVDTTVAERKHKEQLDDLNKTLEKLGDAQAKANDEVGKSKGVFGGLKDSFSGIGDQVSSLPGPIGDVAGMLSNFKLGPVDGIAAVGGAFVAAAGAFGKFQSDLQESRVGMQNSFGLSADAARDMQGEIAEALGSGLGNYEETAMAVTQISQVWGDEVAHMGGQTAAQLSDDFLAFNKTFERSAEETASTVDVLLNSGMVSSAQEGLDLLTKGMQNVPLAMQDEVFDAMNEYSKNFANLGIDGSEAMAMLVDAAENGQYAIDKTGDAIKEYSVLAIDPAKAEAFESLGLNAEAMATAVAGGGDSANQALRDTAQALLDMEDPGKRAATAVELFGAPIEDLGVDQIPAFLESLTAGSDGMGDFEGSAQTMADNTQSTFTGMFNQLKGNIHGFAIDSLLTLNEWSGEVAQSVIDSPIVESVGDTLGSIKELGSGVWDILFEGDYTGLPFGLSEDSGVVDFLFDIREGAISAKDTVVNAWEEIAAAFTGGDWGYGALAQIFGEENAETIINIIADLGDRFTSFKDTVSEAFDDIWAAVEPVFTWLTDFTKDQLGETLSSLWETVQSLAGAWGDVASAIGGALLDVLSAAWEILKSLWDVISPLLLPVLKTLGAIIGGVVVAAFVGIVGAIRVASEVIEALAGVISWVMSNILAPLISIIADVISWIGDRLAGTISAFGDLFGNIFGAIKLIWDGFTDLLFIGYEFIVATVFGGLDAGLEVLKGSFSKAVDAIGKIWDGLKEAAKAPVKFVIDTIWNDGLLRAINAVTGFIGMDPIDPIQIGFARGGILPGHSRMADGDDQLVPMRRGEGVLVSEGLQDQHSRDLFLRANEEAKGGKSFSSFMQDYVAGFANGGIVGSLNSIMQEFYPMLQMTSHYRPGDSGYHGKNMAADFSNTGWRMPSTPEMQAAAKFMYGNYGDQLEQLIHDPAQNIGSGRDVGDGYSYYGAATMADHTDHIHLAAMQPLVDPSGVVQMIPFDGDNSGGFSLMGMVKRLWDGVVDKIMPYQDEGAGWFSQVPGNFIKSAAGKLWELITGKVGSGSYDGAGGEPGVRESWREMAMAAMSRNGFDSSNPAQVEAMLSQIMSESTGIPNRAQEIVDMNGTGASAGLGLLQIIPGTFADHRDPSLPDDRTDSWANMNAALRYYRSRYGGDLTTMWGHGHGYADGGIVDAPELFTRDLGGWVPNNALVRNTSGRDELMLPPELSQAMAGFFQDYPEAAQILADAAAHIETAAEWLNKAADYQSEEGITARGVIRNVLDMGIDLPGAEIISGILTAETEIWDSRTRHLGHIDSLVEKEKALEEARKALEKLESSDGKISTQDQRKIDDANKNVAEAKADQAKAAEKEYKDATKRAEALEKAAQKTADSEEKLARVREDLDANAEKSAEKHAEEITKANDAVAKAEADLVTAKKAQVADLDHLIVLSQDQISGMRAQAGGFASELIGMGAPADLVSQGLGAVSGALGSVAGMAGPAGISLGMVLDLVKSTISLVMTIVETIGDIIDAIHEARQAALMALGDGFRTIAEYGTLIAEMQHNVSTLQQEIVRGLNDQRVAEFALRVAHHDRAVAEANSVIMVAEARLALDKEIERGNIAAQLRLMGLHEDWDTYLSFQALASQGMLDQWSDAAIGALFTYEAARAKALQAELGARLDQINAEAQLAAVTRQNVRANIELLKAQERLIMMSAEVNGIDLVGATASSQMVDLMVQINDLQKSNDSSLLGRGSAWLGIDSPWGKEYKGNEQRIKANRELIKDLGSEYGVNLSDKQIDAALKNMAAVSSTGGDPTAVLRTLFPEFAAAEDLLRKEQAYKPIWDAIDSGDQQGWDIEDGLADNDLFGKTQPLEEAIAGLDYTIGGLEDAANAWKEGNEDLRSEYLGSAWAQYQAGKDLGIDWQLDPQYATPGVRDQIVKEVHIHLDGDKLYTADQVDQLVKEALDGTNAKPVIHYDPTTVANSRRGVSA